MMGRVKMIYPNHYGFIVDEDGTDYFIHAKQYLGDWEALRRISPPNVSVGPVVQFKPARHIKGLRAEEVQFMGNL